MKYFSLCFSIIITGLFCCITNMAVKAQDKYTTPKPIISSFDKTIITSPPSGLGLDPFYKKYADAFGIPVLSSGNVSDDALLVARDIINYMLLKRPDIRAEMIKMDARLSILGKNEQQSDLPECRDWKKPAFDDQRLTDGERTNYYKPGGIAGMTDHHYWDQRARGMGGIWTSCAEENLLGIPGTKYYGENIMVHEFSHNIMSALGHIDPVIIDEVKAAYKAAKDKGMYKGQYAINTVAEYWAEGTQWWFWSNIEFYDGTTRVQSPDDLKNYDPTLYNILARVYPGHHIPCDVYYSKNLKNTRRKTLGK
jgi:hypothetical protein